MNPPSGAKNGAKKSPTSLLKSETGKKKKVFAEAWKWPGEKQEKATWTRGARGSTPDEREKKKRFSKQEEYLRKENVTSISEKTNNGGDGGKEEPVWKYLN